MITTIQSEKIKKLIGINYSNKIAKFLNTQGIVSKNGKAYRADYIRDILNKEGRENTDIEEGIWSFIEHIKETRKKRNKMLNSLIEDNLINEEE